MSNLIVLPTAKLDCDCGNRLATSRIAANLMGRPSAIRQTRTCECGKQVVDEVAEAVVQKRGESVSCLCSTCQTNEAVARIEMTRGNWQGICLTCLDERDAVIAERFGDYIGKTP